MSTQTRISDEQARELLARAAELDRRAADSVSLETLREAAREAGISEAAFSAALGERASGAPRAPASRTGRRLFALGLAAAGAGGMLLLGAALLSRLVP